MCGRVSRHASLSAVVCAAWWRMALTLARPRPRDCVAASILCSCLSREWPWGAYGKVGPKVSAARRGGKAEIIMIKSNVNYEISFLTWTSSASVKHWTVMCLIFRHLQGSRLILICPLLIGGRGVLAAFSIETFMGFSRCLISCSTILLAQFELF